MTIINWIDQILCFFLDKDTLYNVLLNIRHIYHNLNKETSNIWRERISTSFISYFKNGLKQGPANILGRGPKCKVLSSIGPNLASTENTISFYIMHIYMKISFYFVDI